ncbi:MULTISPECIES: ribbon-helix-helix protein, CopG family [Rhizobium]|uniref:ribbon-helix-helix protein, CopG family n=1 Tax=Rhizobium TaxID=379 RepID=UPI0003A5AD18|nr:ribbon-helix-helix protein, CopG family [Rhizobium leguminosarum]MBW8789901.1 ribbon-helix-helix protein, CopG family [Rhizobium leguminosarum]MBY5404877.1 ribbon-helix-helix protein, CopG family [Rhizobium leguminosarum]UWM80067.1 ribbon-helix-helix domain-containing protein [Rhizobium leguminosarum bv. viciae]UWU26826.1 ribbon-helix-helix domain-containing protein [Rhizobium leguminosarum bv. viciae]
METKMLDAHIPLPLAERLDALAIDLALPRDEIVTEAITAWIDQEERRRITALRTIAAANNIVLIEHHRAIDWADSL